VTAPPRPADDPLRLFEGVGIEIELMIVDAATLDVRPIADELLRAVGGGYDLEVAVGALAWSNELALHLVELKTNGPVRDLRGMGATFQEHVGRVNALLAPMGARLLPGGMHPWMDPARELRLWPHDQETIYRTFDRIFDCRGHGWANLQSMHVNLPFGDDEEFGRLHAAIRLVLPILPALAASSPFVEGRETGFLDTRLEVYRHNADRVPSVAGRIVPEQIFTRADYEDVLLHTIYQDLAPHDPEGVLREEWVNARGAIARFDRSAIEIRVLDTQECARADIAVAGAVGAVVRALVEERWIPFREQASWDEERLAAILLEVAQSGDRTGLLDPAYLKAMGQTRTSMCTAGALWEHLVDSVVSRDPAFPEWEAPLDQILRYGCLARRILTAVGMHPSRETLRSVYGDLADCLAEGRLFP
jgi:gamma-glutamyl:cysteine ligase YbdK (ATP-grasp superfamily)